MKNHLWNCSFVWCILKDWCIIVHVGHPNYDWNVSFTPWRSDCAWDLNKWVRWLIKFSVDKTETSTHSHAFVFDSHTQFRARKITWNIIWLRFSASRSSGCSNCNDFPLSKKIWFPFWKINSSAISVNGSPNIGNSGGVVRCSITGLVFAPIEKRNDSKKKTSQTIIIKLVGKWWKSNKIQMRMTYKVKFMWHLKVYMPALT